VFPGIFDQILPGCIVIKVCVFRRTNLEDLTNHVPRVNYLKNIKVPCHDVCGVCRKDLQVGHGERGRKREEGRKTTLSRFELIMQQ